MVAETIGIVIDLAIDRRKRIGFNHLVVPAVGRGGPGLSQP